MSVSSIDIALFKKMVINGAINLKNNHQEINELNVFPVPDGDTGTNMSMTIMSGVRELNACESSSIIEVAKVLSRGALMGARGNSGVILSQFFRGLYVGLKDITTNELSVSQFMTCLDSGRKIAYKAVMSPVEGTILTVVRVAAEKALENLESFKSIDDLLRLYYIEAKTALNDTPNLLPVLKEAGVVDSGGAGFCKIVEGMLMALKGEMLELTDDGDSNTTSAASSVDTDIKFTYCTEFIVDLAKDAKVNEADLKSRLSLVGDSLVLVRDDNFLKVHVHTNVPGEVLNMALKLGELYTVKIENMRRQHSELKDGVNTASFTEVKKEKKNNAIVAVAFGEGIVTTFKDLGVDVVIEGGQTMNPSTEAFVKAIKECNANNVVIIPNNGNVILAAEQAATLVPEINVKVLKAKTIAQGYASMMLYDPEADVTANIENMQEAISNVVSGEITYAIRDTEIKGVKIAAYDFMGIMDGDIVVSTKERTDALKGLLEKIISEDSQIVTFFYGKDVTKEETEALEELCLSINKNIEIEIVNGKQDIYSYIISVE